MSWDAYITNITSSNVVQTAYIFGKDNGALWAKSAHGADISPSEVMALAKGLTSPNDLYAKGGMMCKEKYIFLRVSEEGNALYFKKGPKGACVAFGKQTVVIGLYGEGMQAGACNKQTEKITEYLAQNGY